MSIKIEFLEDIQDSRLRIVDVTYLPAGFIYTTKAHDQFIRVIKRRLPDYVKSENVYLIIIKTLRIL